MKVSAEAMEIMKNADFGWKIADVSKIFRDMTLLMIKIKVSHYVSYSYQIWRNLLKKCVKYMG